MNDDEYFARIHYIPDWCFSSEEFSAVVDHYLEVDEKVLKYKVKPWIEGIYVVMDTHSDDFVYVLKGQTKTKKIWKTTEFYKALAYARELNAKPVKAREELSLTQRIAYMNQRPKKTKAVTPFKRCACGTMYRGDKHCERIDT